MNIFYFIYISVFFVCFKYWTDKICYYRPSVMKRLDEWLPGCYTRYPPSPDIWWPRFSDFFVRQFNEQWCSGPPLLLLALSRSGQIISSQNVEKLGLQGEPHILPFEGSHVLLFDTPPCLLVSHNCLSAAPFAGWLFVPQNLVYAICCPLLPFVGWLFVIKKLL